MKHVRFLSIFCLIVIAGALQPAWCSEVRPIEFLHALQKEGYGDLAVDYLNMLKQRDELPKILQETWDLEMCKSLLSAAQNAYNTEASAALLKESEKYVTKFLKDKPNHPEASAARAIWANFSMDKALNTLRTAQTSADQKQKSELYNDSRNALMDARQRFKQAEEKYQAELEAMPPLAKKSVKRSEREQLARQQELRTNLLNYRFQNALVDYYIAQTYPDSDDKRRKEILEEAAKSFDVIFQANRMETVGLYAHMWHGKTTEELGDNQTALDIYDEVLVNAPDPGQTQTDSALQSLFSQVGHFRMQLLAKQSPQQFIDEAGEWIQQYRKTKFSQTEGYQGIALDLAKAKLDAAETASGTEKSKLITSAMSLLVEMSKVRSPYQQESILLRKKYINARGKSSQPGSFEEAIALGDASVGAQQWAEAEANYTLALKFADKEKIKDSQRQEVRNALADILFRLARDQFIAGKYEGAIAGADKIFKDYKDTPSAPIAGSLAVSAALNIYAAAPSDKKNAALDGLKKYAKLIEDSWPGKPEADDARMMLAQADLVQGKIDQALTSFEKIDPRSPRYPNAILLAAETYWRRWLMEKEKPEENRNKNQMDSDLDKSLKSLDICIKSQRSKLSPGQPLSPPLIEAQLLSAEIKLIGQENAQEAAALLEPLIKAVKNSPPEEVDNVVVRIYGSAVRAYMAQDNLEKAAEVAMYLSGAGPDAQNVNGALVEVVRMLNTKRKQVETTIDELTAAQKTNEALEASEKLQSLNEKLKQLLIKMSSRKAFSIPASVYFAETCMDAGLPDIARNTLLHVADQAEKDPDFAKSGGKALTRIRAKLVDLLAKSGDYEDAYKQVSQLVAANPRALELLMSQGRILQSWSETNPSHYKDAVAHWAKLRNMLQGMIKKPPEYYEVTYNLAASLYGQSSQSEDKASAVEKIKQAEQLLKSTLILSPKLSGPEMVDKYNALLKKINAIQQRSASRKM